MTEKLKRDRRVLFPAPRFPSIEITPDINVIKPLNPESNLTSYLNYYKGFAFLSHTLITNIK